MAVTHGAAPSVTMGSGTRRGQRRNRPDTPAVCYCSGRGGPPARLQTPRARRCRSGPCCARGPPWVESRRGLPTLAAEQPRPAEKWDSGSRRAVAESICGTRRAPCRVFSRWRLPLQSAHGRVKRSHTPGQRAARPAGNLSDERGRVSPGTRTGRKVLIDLNGMTAGEGPVLHRIKAQTHYGCLVYPASGL